MQPAIAGIIIPTVWLGILAAFPYFDRKIAARASGSAPRTPSGSPSSPLSSASSAPWFLILWDSGKLAEFVHKLVRHLRRSTPSASSKTSAPSSRREFTLAHWSLSIPYSPWNIKIFDEGNTGYGATSFQHLNFPALLVEQAIPISAMVGLPCLLIYSLWRIGWVFSRRDALHRPLQRLRRRLRHLDTLWHRLPWPEPGTCLALGTQGRRRHSGRRSNDKRMTQAQQAAALPGASNGCASRKHAGLRAAPFSASPFSPDSRSSSAP